MQFNPSLPQELVRIIGRALEKDFKTRYQTPSGIRADLWHLKHESETGRRDASPAPAPARRRTAFVAGPGGLSRGVAVERLAVARPYSPMQRKAVAVLYFSNLSQDRSLDWLDRGLTEMLTTNLSEVRGLDVLSTECVASVLDRLGRKQVTAEIAPELARRSGVRTFISGALLRVGASRLRIDVRVQDATGGQILLSEKMEGEGANALFKMVDEVTARMAPKFLPAGGRPENVRPSSKPPHPIWRRIDTTKSDETAHSVFLYRDAIREYEEALRLDPQFALALVSLGRAYTGAGDYVKRPPGMRSYPGVRGPPLTRDRLTFDAIQAGLA